MDRQSQSEEQAPEAKPLAHYAHEAALHHRARTDMLRKLMPIYGLTQKDFELPADVMNREHLTLVPLPESRDRAIDQGLDCERWHARFTECFGEAATEETYKTVWTEMRALMYLYTDAFQARKALLDRSDEKMQLNSKKKDAYHDFYLTPQASYNLGEAYVNHVTNEVQARLTLLTGGDREAAFKLHTYLVREVVDWARTTEPFQRACSVSPTPQRYYTPDENIAAMRAYGQDRTEKMNQSWRRQKPPRPSHIERISQQDAERAANPSVGR